MIKKSKVATKTTLIILISIIFIGIIYIIASQKISASSGVFSLINYARIKGSQTPSPKNNNIDIDSPGSLALFSQAIRISTDNYVDKGNQLADGKPLIVAAVATDKNANNYDSQLMVLASIKDKNILKIVGLTSYSTLQKKLNDIDQLKYLKSIGIIGFTYNTEGQHTPKEEMRSLTSAQSDNSVAKFASLAKANGFISLWVPPGEDILNRASVDAAKLMFKSGLDGIVIQEQRLIENSCVEDRVKAVQNIINKYKTAAGKDLIIGMQVMPSRCTTANTYGVAHCNGSSEKWSHCSKFISELNNSINFISIWASAKPDVDNLPEFSNMIRKIMSK